MKTTDEYMSEAVRGRKKVEERLGEAEQLMLRSVNDNLKILTEQHHPDCNCELCKARMLTDCSEPDFFNIRYVPHDVD